MVAAGAATAIHQLEHLSRAIDDPELLGKPFTGVVLAHKAGFDRTLEQRRRVRFANDPGHITQCFIAAGRCWRRQPKITRVPFVERTAFVNGIGGHERSLLGGKERRADFPLGITFLLQGFLAHISS